MKKIVLVAIMASFAISPSFAGTPGSDNSVTAKQTGSGAAAYHDPGFNADVTCNETQHRKFDTVQCTFAVAKPELAGVSGSGLWLSDFDGSVGTITYTINLDGSGYSGKATY
jgi:hypothetical protein